ncbi:hypothetical protein HRR83_004382 [Exophiala dermatitidis]|uniref:Uncharacterized protein n=2 Tax=Exophiala dermatitidis TaxID=5970 RepID=H6BQ50_EXODN|nr:uncharacterized protein HMPREF1120_02664 [Exophiala dermatitidis NIH/UT8656]KAJ4511580.1 hypothetical protein HRR73_006155 [Exophiala dermatitidis]EHY54496.1 hypothetical protein HMPREF1120_02664 [Exophiala dermatitidis NIH/UT8656]KAJ4521313.1 hypothetical protein HRR74_003136 [Exophiala dermatitidis]KAJ4541980.1 hypothetical protein HRR77_005871 [Exophiala dermatitidis]KAJ4544745.1 hypothetical protein HRR76_002789 [Exophiala dermatitidis]
MAGMNPAAAAGGPVGSGMNMMNNGSPATQANNNGGSHSPDQVKMQLNTYIYEYFLRLGHYDIARSLLREEKFELRTRPPIKQSPGRRKDPEVNGVDGDAMDTDAKDDIPDDLPRPMHFGDNNSPGIGFLFEWFSVFSDLFAAHQRSSKMQSGQAQALGPAAQYLIQHQNMQRMRENQQSQNLARPGMMNANQFAMRANMRNNMMNGNVPRDMSKQMTPQQVHQLSKAALLQQQQQMQREQGDVEMNGRASSPAEGENGGSPSKRPRLEGQQFNGGMMPNVRPGMSNVPPQNMMIQNAFNPNMNNAQFRQNGGMPQKPMQGGMANGMMNMGNAGSPMMQGINPQFSDSMQMEMYNQRMAGQQMQGTPGGGQSGNHALQDYQMQLMLLEQQNKKRLMMARQEQDNAVNRDGGPLVGMQPAGMSPSNSRTGTSPNPADQMKRTPQMGGMPGSPSAAEAMAGRSPAPMNFMNGMPASDFNPAMFMKENQGMVGPGGPNMRPPTSMEMQQSMARQQQQNRMAQQFQGGQPMAQQPSQGQPQPIGTPGQRNEMPPPQAPAGNNAQRNQPASPQNGNAPPTPSTTNKPNPKAKKAKDENKKRPAKKNSTANAPSSENEPPATPTPSTPITPVHPPGFNSSGKPAAPNMQNNNQSAAPNQNMPQAQPQMHQPDLSQPNAFSEFNGPDQNFNLDFSTLENSDVLENFDFDSFLNTTNDDTFNFDGTGIGVGGDFSLDASGE